MKQVIITGAASMIGSATVAEALKQDLEVAAVVRNDSPRSGNLAKLYGHPNLSIIECGIQNYGKLSFQNSYDTFIHMAWQNTAVAARDDVYSQIDNITYTMDAINLAHRAGCTVFVDTGSQAEYGLVAEALKPNTSCNPESGYGIAKYAAGKMALLRASQLGIRACHTRILSVYGEGMPESNLISYLIKTLLSGDRPSLTKCEQIWDYMYVRDSARALLSIAEKGVDQKIYPLGSGCAKTLREYVEIVRDCINPKLDIGFAEKPYYPHQPMFLCADITELKNDTGFELKYGFEEGIRKTIEWYINKQR